MMSSPSVSRMVWPSEPLSSDSAGNLSSADVGDFLIWTPPHLVYCEKSGHHLNFDMFGAIWWKAESPIPNKCGARLSRTMSLGCFANSFPVLPLNRPYKLHNWICKTSKYFSQADVSFSHRFRHSLMTWGEKFSSNEIDDAFREFKIDGGMIDAEHLKSIMVAKKDGEE